MNNVQTRQSEQIDVDVLSSPERSSESSNSTTTECPLLEMLMEVQ